MESVTSSAEEMPFKSDVINRKESHHSELHPFIGKQSPVSPNPTEDEATWNSLESTPNLREGSAMLWSKEFPAPTKETLSIWECTKPWWLEALATLMVLSSLIATTILLLRYQRTILSDWPYIVSLTTVISVSATVLKAAVSFIAAEGISQLRWMYYLHPRPLYTMSLFENASRGSISAFKLLIKVNIKQFVASIGALLVLGSHVIDISTQSMVQFPSCDGIQQDISDIVPRTNNFTLPGMSMDGGSDEMIILPFQQMIYGGIMGLNLSSYLTPSCITGNCSVDAFWTVGYSSECSDATDQLVVSSGVSNAQKGKTYRWPTNNLSIAITNDTSNDDEGPTADPLLISYTGPYTYWGAQIQMMLTNSNATVHAVQCNMNPSVQKFSSEVTLGLLSEKLQESYDLPKSMDSGWNHSVLTSCLSPHTRSLFNKSDYLFNGSEEWVWVPSSSLGKSIEPIIPLECAYDVSSIPDGAIYKFIQEVFTDSITTMQRIEVARGSPALQALHNNGNNSLDLVSARMQNMTNAMTLFIRMNGDISSSKPASGIMHTTATCIDVRWPLFVIPLSIGLSSILFLAATLGTVLFKGRQLNWKSSTLPYLFHRLDLSVHEQYGSIDELGKMKEYAKRTKVQLAETADGWRLVEAVER